MVTPKEDAIFASIPSTILLSVERRAPPMEVYAEASKFVVPTTLGIVHSHPLAGAPLLGAVLHLVDQSILVPALCVALPATRRGASVRRFYVSLQQLLRGRMHFTATHEVLRACLAHAHASRPGGAARRGAVIAGWNRVHGTRLRMR